MKIGDAGEAFFVFETEEEVPADLITSPILQPVADDPDDPDNAVSGTSPGDDALPQPQPLSHQTPKVGEPDFLDLNALPSPPEDGKLDIGPPKTPTIEQTIRPPFTPRPSGIAFPSGNHSLPSPPPTPLDELPAGEEEVNRRADEALARVRGELHVPEVQYHDGIPFPSRTHGPQLTVS